MVLNSWAENGTNAYSKHYKVWDSRNLQAMLLYLYRNTAKEFAIIRAAVDDLTITAANEDILHRVKKDLENIFKMKDLGEIHWLLTSRSTKTNKPAQSQFHKKHTLIVFLKDLIFKMLKHIQVLWILIQN